MQLFQWIQNQNQIPHFPTQQNVKIVLLWCTELSIVYILSTVKSSNFVILLSENIFFHRTFLWVPQDFFRYWNLYSNDLGIGQSHFGLGHCLGLENSVFRRVTKLGGHLLISSPSKVFKVTMMTGNRGCKCPHCFCDGKILWTFTKIMMHCKGLYDDYNDIYKINNKKVAYSQKNSFKNKL